MDHMFSYASTFTGKGLDSWITTAVTTLWVTFYALNGPSSMNADLSKWDVAKVQSLYDTFYGASKFKAVGLEKWTVNTAVLSNTFNRAISIPACTKYRIYSSSSWSADSKVQAVYPNWDNVAGAPSKCQVRCVCKERA